MKSKRAERFADNYPRGVYLSGHMWEVPIPM